jgi:predicted nucleic acid-binding protein
MADKLKVFVDSDVLIAGSASARGASFVVLHLADLTVITCIISEQVLVEVERNLIKKLPDALPAFRALVDSALVVVPDPSLEVIAACAAQADPKDAPILAAALENECRFLLTFNTRHYWPESERITVLRPGDFLSRLRQHLMELEVI